MNETKEILIKVAAIRKMVVALALKLDDIYLRNECQLIEQELYNLADEFYDPR